jgi:hypothetical protein
MAAGVGLDKSFCQSRRSVGAKRCREKFFFHRRGVASTAQDLPVPFVINRWSDFSILQATGPRNGQAGMILPDAGKIRRAKLCFALFCQTSGLILELWYGIVGVG